MSLQRITRFILSYALVGVVVAGAVVWLAPDVLNHGTTAPRPVEQQLMLSGDGLGVASYADAVASAAPAVVNIYTATRQPDPRNAFLETPQLQGLFDDLPADGGPPLDTSLGSGVVVSADGHVLTNNHVIQGAAEIQVLLADGRRTPAQLVGNDPESDLAVLRIEADDLPFSRLAPAEQMRVGDVVFAIGNPFGVGQTVTQGIISALGRSELGLTTFENFIQTDAAINPGNSGGALVNTDGEIIGINTAIFSRSGGSMGIGFAIPAALARAVFNDIIDHGRVIRGWIGIQIQDSPIQKGVRVAGILPGGPSDQAGLQIGDIISQLEGTPVAGVTDLLNRITERDPGSEVRLTGRRQDQSVEWTVRIAERPPAMGQRRPQQPPGR
ncbi:S1C family serine protease [Spiribacter pallidus]|uniref:Trypsin-like peptidase domain-containing protein n=1 Tax=Spiribacter pallidus TaxID=1987936 RepID=A0ABV3TA95_9GAMM